MSGGAPEELTAADVTPPADALPTRWPGVYQQPGSDVRFFADSGIQQAILDAADKIPPGDNSALIGFARRNADGTLEARVALVTKQFGDHLKASVAGHWKSGEGFSLEAGEVLSW
jgi:hypothetical protein